MQVFIQRSFSWSLTGILHDHRQFVLVLNVLDPAVQRTPFNPAGNMNMQPGLGIIPTLFGLQHGQGACEVPLLRASVRLLPLVLRGSHAGSWGCAGQGGYAEPLTPEQQHQVRLHQMLC